MKSPFRLVRHFTLILLLTGCSNALFGLNYYWVGDPGNWSEHALFFRADNNFLCNLTDAGLDDVHCENNNESPDPTDDYIWFTLNPTGTNLGSGYNVSVNTGSITLNDNQSPLNVSYGNASYFRLQAGSAGAGDVVVTVTDATTGAACAISVTITDPGACSGLFFCAIIDGGLDELDCNNNETSGDPSDDFITFSLDPFGFTLGASYSLTASSGTVTLLDGSPATGIAYGNSTQFRLQDGSVGAGDVTIFIADSDDQGCTLEVLITDPGVCSICNLEVAIAATNQFCVFPGQLQAAVTAGGSGPFTFTLTGNAYNQNNTSGLFAGLTAGMYTLVVTDGSGCSYTNNFINILLIPDTQAPVFNQPLPQNQTISCSDPVPLPPTVTASDDCDGPVTPVLTTLTMTGNCPQNYTIIRTWTATDAAGNSATVSQTITVQDQTGPTVTAGTIALCYATTNAAEAAALSATTATDNCTGPLTFSAATQGSCSAVVTVTVRDGCGNQNTAVYNTRIDNTAPVINGPLPENITIGCSTSLPVPETLTATDNCDAGTAPNLLYINEIHYDNVGTDVNEFIEVAGTAGTDLSQYQLVLYNGNGGVTYTTTTLSGIVDNEGNSGFGAVAFTYPANGLQNGGTVAVPEGDGIALIKLPNQVIQFISYEGSFMATNGPAMGMVSTNIGVQEPGSDPVGMSLQLTGSGTPPTTWTGPLAQSPGTLNANEIFIAPPSTLSTTFSQTTMMGTCTGSMIVIRTWTASDACGNTSQYTQTIQVVDQTPPVFAPPLPQNVTISCSDPIPPAAILIAVDACNNANNQERAWINEIHYDNAGVDVGEFIEIAGTAGTDLSQYSLYLYNGSTGNMGGTYTSTNLSGLIDNENNGFGAVAFTYPTDGIQNGPSDGIALVKAGIVLQFLSYEGVLTAVGGPANSAVSTDIGVMEDGTNASGTSLRLTGNGNTYNDFTWNAPAAATPGSINTGQTFTPVSIGLPVTFNETTSAPAPACPYARTITRTWVASDACGNSVSAIQVITIQDDIAPVVTCQPLTVTLNNAGTATITPANITFTATDNCSPANALTTLPNTATYTCAQAGSMQPFSVQVQDQCGNIGMCTTQVSIAAGPNNATATPAAQTVCSGVAITTIVLNSSVGGTTYTWMRDNTVAATGIAANGMGNISGTLTNATMAPVNVTFTITPSGNGCMGTPVTATVLVNPMPTVNDPADQVVCNSLSTTVVNFTGTPASTTFNWTNNTPGIGLAATGSGNIPTFTAINNGFTPVVATITVTPVYYNVQNQTTCTGAQQTFTITVNPSPDAVAIPAMQTICSGAAITTIVLTGNVTNTTYTWMRDNTATVMGIAATGSGNISGSLINMTAAPVSVTFTITPSANGCTGTPIMATVLVNPAFSSTAMPATQTICSGIAITPITVAGATYTWTRDNTATVTGIAASGSGTISGTLINTTNAPVTVTFTITPSAGSCMGTPVTATVVVNPVPALFALTGGGRFCATGPGVDVGLTGSQTGVNYQLQINAVNSGTPVAGTGNALNFGPQTTGGVYTAVATAVVGGCTVNMTGTVTVAPFDCNVAISDPCVCLNNATTLTNGQFGETIKVNAPGTQIWTVTAINGLYLSSGPAPPAAPVPIPVGTVLTNIGGDMFTLTGIHVDAIGYNVTVTNQAGFSLSIGNSCQYPNPAITADLAHSFCLNSPAIPLTGTPGDANIVSATFTVNGAPATTFNPAAGPGQYLVTYTVNGGAPKAAGPNDPGCIQSVAQFVNVVATPSQLACNDLAQISLDATCMAVISPQAILEGNYGCFGDYLAELDKTPPYGNGPWVPAVVGAADIGKTYQVRVIHLPSGNRCWGNVHIEDKLPPVLTCPPFTIPCNASNVPGVIPVLNLPANPFPNGLVLNFNVFQTGPATYVANPGTLDACTATTLTYIDTETPLACASGLTSSISRKYTAIDASGNTATCIQLISLLRPTLADVVLPPNYDNIQVPAFNCLTGIYPTPDYIQSLGLPGFPYVFGLPQGCNINWGYTDLRIDVCDGTYKIARSWIIIDWCTGATLEYLQIIKVLDTIGPTLACPANLTVSTDPFQCCATVNMPNLIISDNCSRINNISGMVVTFDQFTGIQTGMFTFGGSLTTFPGNDLWNPDTLAAFGFTPCLPLGTQRVTYVAEDDCGNTRTCSFNLTVADEIRPTPSCDQVTKVSLGTTGMAFINASVLDDGSYDNCAAVYFKARRMNSSSCQSSSSFHDQIKFCCSDVGDSIRVVLRVYDVAVPAGDVSTTFQEEHSNDCMVWVTVDDKIAPVCQPPVNMTVNCANFDPTLAAYGQAVVTDNCCLQPVVTTANYSLFDTVCNRGTITRTFRASDCHGLSSQCTQRVVVNYTQDYYVKFPADQIVTVCDGTGNFGEPTFFNEDCELLGSSFEDQIFTVVPDACYKIERTWTVINWCTYNPNAGCVEVPNPNPNATVNSPQNLPGVTISALGNTVAGWAPTVVKIDPNDGAPILQPSFTNNQGQTNYAVFYQGGNYTTRSFNGINGAPSNYTVPPVGLVNCYRYKQIIKIIDTKAPVIANCPASPVTFCDVTVNDPFLWNEAYYYDPITGSHDLCEGPTDLTITASDACSLQNINIRYLLFLDLNQDGVMETVINSNNLPGYNTVFFGNALNQNYIGGIPYNFDERLVPFNQKYGFALQTRVVGTSLEAHVAWNTQSNQSQYVVPELPYGTHKIKWYVADGCGNESTCEYNFIVRDCKAPTIVCLNGLAANIMPTTLWAIDFLQYAQDNCTPANLLKFGIRRSGTGTGFPVNPDGTPQTSITFTCADIGIQNVELWAIDLAGNADFCATFIVIQDNQGNCDSTGNVTVAGSLKTETGSGLEEANVEATGSTSTGMPFIVQSDAAGFYEFTNIPFASDLTITPTKDNNPLNGVSTFDLVLISRHILGLEPLTSPYKMIAADGNKSGSITTSDIVELRKLILGIYQKLPNNTSWRFVDKDFVFPNPANPFQTLFPENKTMLNIQQDHLQEDFVAIKIGDVNQNAEANAQAPADDRTVSTLLFDVEDRQVKAGEAFAVTFQASESTKGYQFTLNLNGLTVVSIEEDKEVKANNFGVFNLSGVSPEALAKESNALTVSIDGAPAFMVHFRATKSGKISEMMQLSSQITKAEGYVVENETVPEAMSVKKVNVALRFNQGTTSTITGVGFELYQNQPNPFASKTFIGFHLPVATSATLTVYDESGRVLFKQTGKFTNGYNSIAVERALLHTNGLMYYKLETPTDVATKKMIQTP